MSGKPTETRPRPDPPAGHRREGDARSGSDTLDRGQEGTPGGQPPEDVEDRPVVGTVKPEDYPKDLPDH